MRKTKAAVSLLTVSALVLGLTSFNTTVFAETGTSDLNIMLETPVESLDPQQATDGTSFEVIADYTDGLMQMDRQFPQSQKAMTFLKTDLPTPSIYATHPGAMEILSQQQTLSMHGREQLIRKSLLSIPTC